ncbi:hypothetical protein ACTNB0_09770 [Lachnospiraceae bacterium HCP28S3_F9]|uniref:hypothetical protein n=1 Tax=Bariatricus sp. SGI.161 TaxID=3420550 RepID=UPI003CFDD416
MVKKINLVMFILLIIFTMTGCTSSIKNTQEEKQKIKYSEEDVTDTINNYYGEYYPNGPNGSMDDVLDDGTVVGKTFDYYYDSDFEELACIVYIDLYTGDIVEKASDGTIVDEYNIEDILADSNQLSHNTTKSNFEKEEAGYYDFNKNILVGFGFEMILKSDGTIIAKGRNNNGELGNGTLTDSDSWIEVPGIDNVIQIAYDGNEQMCTIYALKEDGTVWWWGSEQISPKKIDGLDNVKELMYKGYGDGSRVFNYVYAHMNDNTIVNLANDKVNVVEELEGIALDDFSLEEIVGNSYIYYIYLVDGKAYYIDSRDQISVPLETEQTIEKVYNYGGNHYIELLSEEGERLYYAASEGCIKSHGGNNIIDYYSTEDYDFSMLFGCGQILACGENDDGELGNGTQEPYKSQWWEVDIPKIEHLFTPLNNKIYAIDEDNNLWAWGKGFSSVPTIQYNIDEIVSNY